MVDSAWLGCPSGGDLVARFNKKEFDALKSDVGTVDYPLKGQRWIFPEDTSVDSAYTFLDGVRFDDLKSANEAMRLSELPSVNEQKSVHIGDSVVSAGLLVTSKGDGVFQNAVSDRRNYPIFKFGNVSSIPEESG